jgi:nucleoid-associated protein YgaU
VVKKLAIVLSVVLTGVGLAHCFRKDASPETSARPAIEPPAFREPVARRLIPAPPVAAQPETPPAITSPFHIPLAETRASAVNEPLHEPTWRRPDLATNMVRPPDLDEDAETAFDRPTLAEPTGAHAASVTHKIGDGDTLSGIAAKYLGRADRYLEIYNANRDVLKSPDLLPIGKTLKIPGQ